MGGVNERIRAVKLYCTVLLSVSLSVPLFNLFVSILWLLAFYSPRSRG